MGKQDILPKRVDILEVGADDSIFRINVDVLNEAFGVGRAMYARACYPDKKNVWIAGEKQEDKYFIWMAKLYGNSSEWANSISSDGRTIYEIAEGTRTEDWISEENYNHELGKRIVFLKDSAKSPYRFVGVFENGEMNHLRHSYKRIATKIRLIGNPVYKIEILENVK